MSPSANADLFFLGIGNDEFQTDVDVSLGRISPYVDAATLLKQQTGPGIINGINNVGAETHAGDIFIVHYAGHGDLVFNDVLPADEADGAEGVIGTFALGDPGARDDDVGAVINGLPESVAVMSIFDCCFAGEMVDGGADIGRGLVIGTADETCVAPGESIFLPFWIDAFSPDGAGSLKADANGDRFLTMEELYDHLANIVGTNPSNPYAVSFETTEHLAYGFAVPEPSGYIISIALGLAALVSACRLQRRP